MSDVKKVAVIGAGAMGSGIAAQAANAGCEVVLLDKFEGVADKAVARMKKAKPTDVFNAGFMVSSNAKRVTTGTIDNDIEKIADADVIVEAVFERLDIKQETFNLIHKHAKKDAVITSNTSTIQIEKLVEGMPEDFKKRFMNTHFFNPVRFMALLEVIQGKDTDPAVFEQMREFGDKVLGKKVVKAKDSPAFIGNRIGVYMIERATKEAKDLNFPIEDVDAILSPAFGFPKLGVYKLGDTVGIDILQHVGQNLHDGLPTSDEFNEIYDPAFIEQMVEDKRTGRKSESGEGFYRVKKDDDGNVVTDAKGKPVKQAIDLKTGEYSDAIKSKFFKMNFKKKHGSYAKFFDSNSRAATFAWPVMRDTMLYVLNHAEDIAFDTLAVDEAMRAGFNWKKGPFQLLDEFGVEWFADKVRADGIDVPSLLEKAEKRGKFYTVEDNTAKIMTFDGSLMPTHREDGTLRLSDIKLKSKPLVSDMSASSWDIGDGVVCFEFHGINNMVDPTSLNVLNKTLKMIEDSNGKYKALVVYNEGDKFSAGANIGLVHMFNTLADNKLTRALGLSNFFKSKVYDFLGEFIFQGQAIYKAMREAPFPVIGAPKGQPENMALGGGCEILLHCDAVQSGPEQVMGLVEAGVGLIPAWGGCARYLERAQDAEGHKGPMAATMKATMAIAAPMEGMGFSAQDAMKKLWLRKDVDQVSMNPDHVLIDAKNRALSMTDNYTPPVEPVYHLPGKSGKAAIRMNVDTMYMRGDDPNKGVNHVDVKIADCLADVTTGGETVSQEQVESHVADHKDRVRELISASNDQETDVYQGIPLTEARILQLERNGIMTLAHTDTTSKRLAYMVEKKKPLREKHLDPMANPSELRNELERVSLPLRSATGKPLDGEAEERLQSMAKTSRTALNIAKKLGLA
ncbi:MAG: 3-hydroxyacyl-CoA dehydrogenase [Micavibrio sp.]|nr:3-hydroxyacyl-CoA dehydrogenase [Micavibrio sp.]